MWENKFLWNQCAEHLECISGEIQFMLQVRQWMQENLEKEVQGTVLAIIKGGTVSLEKFKRLHVVIQDLKIKI